MRTIILIACSKTKATVPAPAQELYSSPLFRMSLRYAKSLDPDAIYILSAKHGLVLLDQRISPYDLSLHQLSREQRTQWAKQTLDALAKVSSITQDHYVFLAGKRYYQDLLPHLGTTSIPFAKLGLGRRLSYLKHHI